ncbi:PQQ-dependent sugar dehydrogenase [Paenibacillus soyae]|uniref:PQQ-dependent sugar dehydrogenase n=1 Tax=Paenibacillus soyae TaxID=2969249 RepID=A0A9X2S8L1_9BACL|nr:PQQ-dependent sugar dehydrogenase [Paenibacillus soyae]MCR2804469.1 PQQ-dependent sugar dehydrogenase [Paenibacillus soyae]
MSRPVKLTIAWLLLAAVASACNDGGNGSGSAVSSNAAATPTPSALANNGSEETPKPSEAAGQSAGPYEVIGTELRIPWSIAFNGSTIYMSEREGNIVKVEGGKTTREAVRLTKAVNHEGEGGFLGLLLAPDFSESGLAYAYHTYREQGKTLNRIVLLKKEGAEWAEQRAVLEGIPGDLYHNGGRLAFGPDGMLYATTGDAEERALSQDKSSLAGKILRLTTDGGVPSDNPFPDSYVYSYGHRNPQGLAWTKDGVMYSTEHGPSGNPGGHDEVNRIVPGRNYGWPTIIGDAGHEGMEKPLYHTGEEAIAPSGTITDAQGRLIIAALRGEAIYRYTPESGQMEVLHKGDGRIRDVQLRDGRLYFITNNTDGRGTPSESDDRLVSMDYN